jgi:glucose/mannose-6-phosphate isomerase
MAELMAQWLDQFPEQIQRAYKLADLWEVGAIRTPHSIVFLGMGGSAIGADLACGLYGKDFALPVSVVRGEQIPRWVGADDLAVAVSYSGETRETLAAFRSALRQGARGLAISSGGTLKTLAEENGVPHLLIPGGIAPRAALGFTTIPLLKVLRVTGTLPAAVPYEEEIPVLVKQLESLRVDWGDPAGAASGVARRMLRRLPLIAGVGLTAGAARRFQAQLAENAKVVSVVFELPEALHNLVETLDVSYIDTYRPIAVYLEDPEAEPEARRMMKALRDAFSQSGIEGIPIPAQGKSPLTRLFTLIHKTDWVSYHLAKLKGVDAAAIPIITSIKKKLTAL